MAAVVTCRVSTLKEDMFAWIHPIWPCMATPWERADAVLYYRSGPSGARLTLPYFSDPASSKAVLLN